ncbi:hypothetical protein IDM33_04030 [Acinetobacter seifertii]|nr:hypothetical protein [Acinetobacter seifertii]
MKVPARTGHSLAYPQGTYTATVQLFWDMDLLAALCLGDVISWSSGNVTLTANFVVPTLAN